MSLTIIKQISLDMYNNNFVSINAKQYDTSSRFLDITCTENGKQMILDKNKIKAFVRYKKSDGNNVLNEAEILDNGKVRVELTQQMLASHGRCQAELMLVYADGEMAINKDLEITESSVLSTMYFYINVMPVSINDKEIESTREYNALLRTVTRMVAVEKELQENENERASAEATRKTNESVRISNENTRKANETIRQSNETTRKNQESTRVTAENSRVNAENARSSAESLRVTAETNRAQAESVRKTSENSRITAETNRANAEQSRVTAETSRVNAEKSRVTAENARVDAEKLRQTNTTNAISACETATTNANDSANAANTAATKANTATTNANNATTSANDATTSATNAATRANEAAKACEDIVAQSGLVFTKDIYNGLDATTVGKVLDATQGQVLNDKIVALQEAIDALPQILSGTSAPSNTLGKDGDIYMQIIES